MSDEAANSSEHVYDVKVYREDGAWMVSIPELGGLTYSPNFESAELMAREYIAVSLDLVMDDVQVRIAVE